MLIANGFHGGVYPWGFSASWANDEVLKIFAQREAQRGTVAGQIGGETACSAVYARARFTNWSLRDDKITWKFELGDDANGPFFGGSRTVPSFWDGGASGALGMSMAWLHRPLSAHGKKGRPPRLIKIKASTNQFMDASIEGCTCNKYVGA